ncbi:TPA: hypothetical protein N3A45_003664 [Salmonella enterica subsp. salamae serovar [1],40:z35:e,n,x,z15]|nr:hypothetical protein [Salmonella enterica]HCM2000518.1 hypothetical protein [Salmonella enterica subsp. salamae serovar [1],40:z35:e,n,x,z15]
MKILTKTNRRGYFGIKLKYNLLGIPVFSILRKNNHDEIKILNKKIFTISRKEDTSVNIENSKKNILLATQLHNKKRKILYVITDLSNCGGVERRLESQFNYLVENGWFPMIISMTNNYDKLMKYPNFYLNFKLHNAKKLFEQLIEVLMPNVIEFQFKPTNFFYDLDICSLLKKYVVGCCVHEEIKIEQSMIDKLDYRIASAHRKSITNATYILNWTEWSSFSWKYTKQKKAILITRISKDKLISIVNFVKICNRYNIDYDIAGAFDNASDIVSSLVKDGLNKNAFIGHIDTIQFLKENANKYLFVAGVGQAIMEGASLGYPSLVTSFTDDYQDSSFITPDNIKHLKSQNFVIRNTQQLNMNVFFENVHNNIVPSLFNVSENMYEISNINFILPEYLNILNDFYSKTQNNT